MKTNTNFMETEVKKERVDLGAVSWRVGSDRKNQLIEQFGSANSQIVADTVMDVFFDEYPSLKAMYEKLQKSHSELQEQFKILQEQKDNEFGAEIHQARLHIEQLQKEKDEQELTANETARKLTALTIEVEKLQEENNDLRKEDPELIPIRVGNPIVRDLLQELKKHLQERYKREVSFYEIFVKSTLLYNIEKRCDWFYPPLKDSTIEEVSGKSIRQWKAFLLQKEG